MREPYTLREIIHYAVVDYDELGDTLATDQAIERLGRLFRVLLGVDVTSNTDLPLISWAGIGGPDPPGGARVEESTPTPCGDVFPNVDTWAVPVTCQLPAGHPGSHQHVFAVPEGTP